MCMKTRGRATECPSRNHTFSIKLDWFLRSLCPVFEPCWSDHRGRRVSTVPEYWRISEGGKALRAQVANYADDFVILTRRRTGEAPFSGPQGCIDFPPSVSLAMSPVGELDAGQITPPENAQSPDGPMTRRPDDF